MPRGNLHKAYYVTCCRSYRNCQDYATITGKNFGPVGNRWGTERFLRELGWTQVGKKNLWICPSCSRDDRATEEKTGT